MHGCRTHTASVPHKSTTSPQHWERRCVCLTSACKPIKLISKPAGQPRAHKTVVLLVKVRPKASMASVTVFRLVITVLQVER